MRISNTAGSKVLLSVPLKKRPYGTCQTFFVSQTLLENCCREELASERTLLTAEWTSSALIRTGLAAHWVAIQRLRARSALAACIPGSGACD